MSGRALVLKSASGVKASYFIPDANPVEAPAVRWYPTSGFEAIPEPGSPKALGADDGADRALDLAAHLTAMARRIRHPSKGMSAQGLHVLAAELRREAGRWSLCIENYDALTRHYLAWRELAPALAYMRKLAFVAESAGDPLVKVEAKLLAAEVYRAVGRLASAKTSADEAVALCSGLNAPGLLARAYAEASTVHRASRTLAAMSGMAGTCSCGDRLPCPQCHDAVDCPPTEFLHRAIGVPSSALRPASSPWWSSDLSGIALMMKKPGPDGETSYWVAHGTADGGRIMMALPNRPSKAMAAAKMMHSLSKSHGEGTECASSAVIQVVIALDAFINTVIQLINQNGVEAFRENAFNGRISDEGLLKTDKSLYSRMDDIGTGLFGLEWATRARLHDLRLLSEVRNSIVHPEFAEQIAPPVRNDIMDAFEGHPDFVDVAGSIRPQPLPWVDRILTPYFAGWAVELGEHVIAAFREAWQEQIDKREAVLRREESLEAELCRRMAIAKNDIDKAKAHSLKQAEKSRIKKAEKLDQQQSYATPGNESSAIF